MAPKMAPKKATKQSSITSMGFPLLQKPAETCVGRQIQVLGSYWTGRMSTEEANSLYKCTVRDFHALHKWDAGGTPSQVMRGCACATRLILVCCINCKEQSCGALEKQARRAKILRLRSSCAKMLALSCCHVRVWGLTRKSNSYSEKLGYQGTKYGPLYLAPKPDGAPSLNKWRETICFVMLSSRVWTTLNTKTRELWRL